MNYLAAELQGIPLIKIIKNNYLPRFSGLLKIKIYFVTQVYFKYLLLYVNNLKCQSMGVELP